MDFISHSRGGLPGSQSSGCIPKVSAGFLPRAPGRGVDTAGSQSCFPFSGCRRPGLVGEKLTTTQRQARFGSEHRWLYDSMRPRNALLFLAPRQPFWPCCSSGRALSAPLPALTSWDSQIPRTHSSSQGSHPFPPRTPSAPPAQTLPGLAPQEPHCLPDRLSRGLELSPLETGAHGLPLRVGAPFPT